MPNNKKRNRKYNNKTKKYKRSENNECKLDIKQASTSEAKEEYKNDNADEIAVSVEENYNIESLSLLSILAKRSLGNSAYIGKYFCRRAQENRFALRKSIPQLEKSNQFNIMMGYPQLGKIVTKSSYNLMIYDLVEGHTEQEEWKIEFFHDILFHTRIEDVSYNYVTINDSEYSFFTENHVNGGHIKFIQVSNSRENRYPQLPNNGYTTEKKAIWGCDCNNYSKIYAISGEKFVNVRNFEDGILFEWTKFNDNMHSVTINESGNIYYAGSNTGNVSVVDRRFKTPSTLLSGFRGIGNLRLIANETKLIASCFDDKLLQIDLRKNKVSFEYPEHNNEYRKIPFSFDEASNTLCSVGQDNYIRFWSLRDGHLLYYLNPLSEEKTSAWYSEQWQLNGSTNKSRLRNKSGIVVQSGLEMSIMEI